VNRNDIIVLIIVIAIIVIIIIVIIVVIVNIIISCDNGYATTCISRIPQLRFQSSPKRMQPRGFQDRQHAK